MELGMAFDIGFLARTYYNNERFGFVNTVLSP